MASVSTAATTGLTHSAQNALLILRLGLGVIWSANLIFILLPSANFFGGFASLAEGYASSSLIGPGFALFVARHAIVFSLVIAATTAYLSVAFLLGLTTRWACVVGAAFSTFLLLSQWGATFAFPGGTDVGPHPLYLGVYLALAWGRADRYHALDLKLAGVLSRLVAFARGLSPRGPKPTRLLD
ncbi:MAG TPA: hypothetical protein VJS68_04005 [Thermoplasmata archaeon]|nr:hypothetical protein [Thermoplasmata archaeon]